MGSSNLSILGLYFAEPTIFDLLAVPDGVDKDNLIDNIILDCAELEILYTNADFLKAAIGIWSKAKLPSWQKLYDTTQLVYNPIWNKDGEIIETESRDLRSSKRETTNGSDSRTETRNLSNGSTETRNLSNGSTETRNLSMSRTETPGVSTTDTEKVAAYDSTTAQLASQHEITHTGNNSLSGSDTGTVGITGTNTGTVDVTGSDTGTVGITGNSSGTVSASGEDTGTVKRSRVERGNIGVTTTQQMLREEREIATFTIIHAIVSDFKRKFCLLVY